MALWGKLDIANNAPKFLSTDANATPNIDKDNAFFVDLTEAGVAANRAAGLRTPGWNLVQTYTNSASATRRRVEPIAVVRATAADAGDLGVSGNTAIEDATVADS
jgi:hypothetical protein